MVKEEERRREKSKHRDLEGRRPGGEPLQVPRTVDDPRVERNVCILGEGGKARIVIIMTRNVCFVGFMLRYVLYSTVVPGRAI